MGAKSVGEIGRWNEPRLWSQRETTSWMVYRGHSISPSLLSTGKKRPPEKECHEKNERYCATAVHFRHFVTDSLCHTNTEYICPLCPHCIFPSLRAHWPLGLGAYPGSPHKFWTSALTPALHFQGSSGGSLWSQLLDHFGRS